MPFEAASEAVARIVNDDVDTVEFAQGRGSDRRSICHIEAGRNEVGLVGAWEGDALRISHSGHRVITSIQHFLCTVFAEASGVSIMRKTRGIFAAVGEMGVWVAFVVLLVPVKPGYSWLAQQNTSARASWRNSGTHSTGGSGALIGCEISVSKSECCSQSQRWTAVYSPAELCDDSFV